MQLFASPASANNKADDKAVAYVIHSSEEARAQARSSHDLFEKLNQTSGFLDYIRSIEGCPRGIRERLNPTRNSEQETLPCHFSRQSARGRV